MLATIAEITISVRYQLREIIAAFWTNDEITSYVNEAGEIISTETKLLSKLYSHTLISADIINGREVRLNTDFVALDEGGVLYDDKPLEQTSLKELDEYFSSWRDTAGTPIRFYFRGDMIGFFPACSAGGVVKYYGIERATEISGDVVPLSGDYRTVSFRRYMRDYAVGMCWYAKNEDTKGDRWMARFDRGIYNINAILNGHKNQGAKIIPSYTPRGHAYAIRYGRTDVFD